MEYTKYKGVIHPQLYFEDVEVGNEIPALKKYPITASSQAAFGVITGNFSAVHYDHGFAKKFRNYDHPNAHGIQITCWLTQLMTDWIGPNGMLKKLSSNHREMVYVGADVFLTIKGKVIKKYVKGDGNYVECEIWAEDQNGKVVDPGSATVVLPSKIKS
ncbi:MaoC family dehydratase [Thermodesulfobacteriota bacterium]